MRVSFRQGIVQYQVDSKGNQAFLLATSAGITLVATITPFIVTIAQKDANYLIEENISVINAWNGPFQVQGDNWLWIDINQVTGARTFGSTSVRPVVSSATPTSIQPNLHWYDTSCMQMKFWNGVGWQPVIRVFVAVINGGSNSFSSITNNQNQYAGSQININVANFSGSLVFDAYGKPLKTSIGTFFTTESTTIVDGATSNIRLASDLLRATALESIPAYSVVYFNDFNTIKLATPSLQTIPSIFGIVTENLQPSDVCYVYTDCVMTNDQWNWSLMNAPVYVDVSGQVTLTQLTDEFSIGYTVARNAIRIVPPYAINDSSTSTTTSPALTEQELFVMDQQFNGSLAIIGPSSVTEETYADYTLQFTSLFDGSVINSANCHIGVSGQVAYIDGNNRLYVPKLSGPTQVTLSAYYPYGFNVAAATLNVNLVKAQPTGISIAGPTTIYEGGNASYVTTATFADGSTQTIVPVYTIARTDVASIDSSALAVLTFNAAGIAANVNSITDTITATYTLTNGTVLTATLPVTYLRILPISLVVQGQSSLVSGSTAQYQAIVTYNNGLSSTVTSSSTWSLTDQIGLSTLNTSGLLTIGAVYVPSNVTVAAQYTKNGITLNAQEIVTVLIPGLYGTGPAAPSNLATFIAGLQYKTNGTKGTTFSIDDIGATNYMWYAYPMSYGTASFLDVSSQFVGGWDGAGNTGAGPSTAGGPIQVGMQSGSVGITYYVYRTDWPNLGAAAINQWQVS